MSTLTPISESQETPEAASDVRLSGSVFVLSLQLKRYGTRKQIPTGTLNATANPDLIKVHKTILQSEELEAIRSLDGEIRRFLLRRCLPSPFRGGMYLMPAPTDPARIRLIDEIDDRLAQFDFNRAALVETFLTAYPDKIEQAERDLGPDYFSAADYHPISYVRSCFGMFYQYMSFGVPGELSGMPGAIYERERIKSEMQMQEAAEEIQSALRVAMADLVAHLVETLTPKADGSRRRFHDSTLTNMTEFLDTFAARNLTADNRMDDLVRQAKQVLSGVRVDDLRKNDGARDALRANFEKVKETLSGLVLKGGSRSITLVDDDE